MASIRKTKREFTSIVNDLLSNTFLAMYYQPKGSEGELLNLVDEVVAFFNQTIHQINHPAEKHNPRLVRKHYSQLIAQTTQQVEKYYGRISEICSSEK